MRRAARIAAAAVLGWPLAASGAEVALTFAEAPGGVGAGFRIERREADSARFAPIALVGPGVAEFVDRGLPKGATYCYRVRSLARQETAGWSPEVCAFAEDPAPASPEVGGAQTEGGAQVSGEEAAAAAQPPPGEPAAEGAASAGEASRIRTTGGWLQVLD
jgi:hypothetical protein